MGKRLLFDSHCSKCNKLLEQSLPYRLAGTCASRHSTYVGSVNAKTIRQTAVKAQMQPMSFYQPLGLLGRNNESSFVSRFSDTGKIHFKGNARERFAVRFDFPFIHVINYDRSQPRIQVNLDRFPCESAMGFLWRNHAAPSGSQRGRPDGRRFKTTDEIRP